MYDQNVFPWGDQRLELAGSGMTVSVRTIGRLMACLGRTPSVLRIRPDEERSSLDAFAALSNGGRGRIRRPVAAGLPSGGRWSWHVPQPWPDLGRERQRMGTVLTGGFRGGCLVVQVSFVLWQFPDAEWTGGDHPAPESGTARTEVPRSGRGGHTGL